MKCTYLYKLFTCANQVFEDEEDKISISEDNKEEREENFDDNDDVDFLYTLPVHQLSHC